MYPEDLIPQGEPNTKPPELTIRDGSPAVILAPMEGVTDAPMRALLSEVGGFSFCVSEFLRISQDVQPVKTFREHVPEFNTGCATPAGLPVQIQLLGGDPEKLALAAARACGIGARGIDLNFGCPAPTVNRHDGGASLLKSPDRIRTIVAAVRKAVPAHLPVSAKLRLGWDSLDAIHVNAEKAAEGGASWITIHGRTKVQGYTPPAYWLPIGEVRKRLGIPVVANGDIWTLEDFDRCQEETGCEHFMLGRAALADPSLSLRVAQKLGIRAVSSMKFSSGALFSGQPDDWLQLLKRFAELSLIQTNNPGYTVRRIKQWFGMVKIRRAVPWFDTLKRAVTLEEVLSAIRIET